MKKKSTRRFDALWKDFIESHFSDFVKFFQSQEFGTYDLSTVEFIDKELEILHPDKGEKRIQTVCG